MAFPSELPGSFVLRAAAAGLRAEDVSENFILGSGHGGQRRNKRSTTVQLVHHPTGFEVRCHRKRMQHQNRMDAWMILLERLEDWKKGVEQEFARQEHAEWQQKRKRSAFTRKAMLEEKRQRGELKRVRRPAEHV